MQRVPPNMLYESQLVAFASSPATPCLNLTDLQKEWKIPIGLMLRRMVTLFFINQKLGSLLTRRGQETVDHAKDEIYLLYNCLANIYEI